MAKKYIDAGLLRKEIEYLKAVHIGHAAITKETNAVDGLDAALKVVDSLQQEQPDEVLIPRWCLENIENTLRIQHNINNDAKDGETCQDRNIKESLNCVRKLLNGEEITGRERSEPLMKQSEGNLEKELADYCRRYYNYDYPKQAEEGTGSSVMPHIIEAAKYFYELGQKDAANKFDEIEYNRQRAEEQSLGKTLDEAAEEHIKNKYGLAKLLGAEIREAVNDFIAGAEWMARQGETLKVTDDTTWGEVNDFIRRNCDGAKEIQIRNKEESK